MEQFNLFLSSLLLLLISSIILKKARRRNSRRVPGPRRLPIVGNLHLLNPNNPHRSLLSLSLKHGPLMLLQLGSTPTLVISSAAVAEHVFRNHDLAFSGRPPLTAAKRLSYNFADITFSPHGEYWRQARKASVLGLLSPRRIRSLADIRLEEVRELIFAVNDLSVVNLSQLSLSLANNVVCRAALGDEYGGGAKYCGEGRVWIHEILSEAQRLLGGFWAADYFPAMAWVDRLVLGLHASLEKNFEELDKFYDEAIRKHQIVQKEEGGGGRSHYFEDFLHYLLRLHDVAPAGSFLGNLDHVKGILTFIGKGNLVNEEEKEKSANRAELRAD